MHGPAWLCRPLPVCQPKHPVLVIQSGAPVSHNLQASHKLKGSAERQRTILERCGSPNVLQQVDCCLPQIQPVIVGKLGMLAHPAETPAAFVHSSRGPCTWCTALNSPVRAPCR